MFNQVPFMGPLLPSHDTDPDDQSLTIGKVSLIYPLLLFAFECLTGVSPLEAVHMLLRLLILGVVCMWRYFHPVEIDINLEEAPLPLNPQPKSSIAKVYYSTKTLTIADVKKAFSEGCQNPPVPRDPGPVHQAPAPAEVSSQNLKTLLVDVLRDFSMELWCIEGDEVDVYEIHPSTHSERNHARPESTRTEHMPPRLIIKHQNAHANLEPRCSSTSADADRQGVSLSRSNDGASFEPSGSSSTEPPTEPSAQPIDPLLSPPAVLSRSRSTQRCSQCDDQLLQRVAKMETMLEQCLKSDDTSKSNEEFEDEFEFHW